jgi:hypothetical protein
MRFDTHKALAEIEGGDNLAIMTCEVESFRLSRRQVAADNRAEGEIANPRLEPFAVAGVALMSSLTTPSKGE